MHINQSTAKALLFQAIGAERIESLCKEFCKEMGLAAKGKGYVVRPRFSPGYGDFPLEKPCKIACLSTASTEECWFLSKPMAVRIRWQVSHALMIVVNLFKKAGPGDSCARCCSEGCSY